LQGLRALITGASSGIGRALAEEAARAGMRVAVAARSADRLEELTRTLKAEGHTAIAIPTDVTSPEARARAIQTVQDQFGGLDVLINNAGIGRQGYFADSTPENMRKIMEVNFFAPVEMMRLAIPVLTNGRTPAIVNVASMTARRAMAMWTEYSSSKFALMGMCEALRGEMVRFGIDVLAIVPGLTQSDLKENLLEHRPDMAIKHHKGMTTEYVARSILKSLRRNKAETLLGFEARWIVRVNRVWPSFVDRMIGRFVRNRYK